MRNFLDIQVEEKKKSSEFQKSLDFEQAKIWNFDVQKHSEQEKEINEKVI